MRRNLKRTVNLLDCFYLFQLQPHDGLENVHIVVTSALWA